MSFLLFYLCFSSSPRPFVHSLFLGAGKAEVFFIFYIGLLDKLSLRKGFTAKNKNSKKKKTSITEITLVIGILSDGMIIHEYLA